jgi:hypothetical protein
VFLLSGEFETINLLKIVLYTFTPVISILSNIICPFDSFLLAMQFVQDGDDGEKVKFILFGIKSLALFVVFK